MAFMRAHVRAMEDTYGMTRCSFGRGAVFIPWDEAS